MSQSPVELPERKEPTAYDASWKALNQLLRTGSSFSGYERNCCFLNVGHGKFANVSAATAFDLMDDGRGLALVDWDFDGDLDVWTTNRTAPSVRFLRNEMTAGNHFLAVRLRGTKSNRDAIGARFELYTQANGQPQIKTLRAGEGFLSQSSKWTVFGLGSTQTIDRLVVRWPSGSVQSFRDLKPDRYYLVIEESHAPTIWNPPPSQLVIEQSIPSAPSDSDQSRIVLMRRPPLPEVSLTSLDGSHTTVLTVPGSPVLLNLWATWCRPCLTEMEEWSANAESIRAAGVNVVAVCVDERIEDGPPLEKSVRHISERLRFPFRVAFPSDRLVHVLDAVQRTYIPLQRPMTVPTSFLIDALGRLAVIYRGPISVQQLHRDVQSLDADPTEIRKLATPFAGQWLHQPMPLEPRRIAKTLFDDGHLNESENYLNQLTAWYRARMGSLDVGNQRAMQQEFVDVQRFLGALLVDQQQYEEAIIPLRRYLRIVPDDARGHAVMAQTLIKLNRFEDAVEHFDKALEITPDDPDALKKMADLKMRMGQVAEAAAAYRRSLAVRPSAKAQFALANALVVQGDAAAGVEHFREALQIQPDMLPATNNLAWILATWPEPAQRNGEEAVRLAEEMCQVLDHPSPSMLSTLAASYAEAGRYADAVSTLEKAIQLASQSNKSKLLRQWHDQLVLYKAGRPYRMAPRKAK